VTPTRDLREAWEALKAHQGEPESNAVSLPHDTEKR